MIKNLTTLFVKKPKKVSVAVDAVDLEKAVDTEAPYEVKTLESIARAELEKAENPSGSEGKPHTYQLHAERVNAIFNQGNDTKTEMALGIGKRLIGDWPFFGTPPVEEKHIKHLFATRPAFVDFLPFVNYDANKGVFEMSDGISCGAVFDVISPDMDARGKDTIVSFCESINVALRNLPISDEAPFVVQIYAEDRQPKNIAHALKSASKKEAQQSAYSESWYTAMEEHFRMMSNPEGIFIDDRTDGTKGWRAIDRKISLVIFKKATQSQWAMDKRKKPYDQFNTAITTFIKSLTGIGFKIKRMDDQAFYEWLTPWLNPNPQAVKTDKTAVDWLLDNPLPKAEERGAAYDLGQIICPEPPLPIDPLDAERGIMKFGDQYSRFVTIRPLHQYPEQGAFFTDKADKDRIVASIFDQMPAESIMCWTIIPQSNRNMEKKLDSIETKSSKSRSRQSDYAYTQMDAAKKNLISGVESIYYFQCGIYIRADNIETLDDRYYSALSQIDNSRCLKPIKEDHDLFPTDSYIRNLPFVYSWKHDRRHALRATMAYTSHIAAILPFYGRSRGSNNPCFINYNRSGEVIQVNPYHKKDRSRVAHSVLFGPTGSGKSATQVAQSMQSMAVNRPRQFFIDKGGSFSLLGDYYEKHGLTVKRFVFSPGRKDVSFPPYVETKNALKQYRGQLEAMQNLPTDLIQDMYPNDEDKEITEEYVDPFLDESVKLDQSEIMPESISTPEKQKVEEDEEDEDRDYLSEMMNATELMITGGRPHEVDKIGQIERGLIQKALIEALIKSEARGELHARPQDVHEELMILSGLEEQPTIALRLREMAGAMQLWTDGLRGFFFNRFGRGFSDADDVTIIELGVLTNEGNEDMMAVAMISIVSSITALGEKHQYAGRHIEFYQDEGHYVTRSPLLVDGFVKGVKVWRKINIWLCIATQNVEDFPDHARKILDLIEWWWLLVMEAAEARKIEALLELTNETCELIKQCKKEPPFYAEGVMLSKKFPNALIRLVPPALCLALSMTDGDEKKALQEIQDQHNMSRLDAAIYMSRQIVEKRKTFSPGYVEHA